MTRTCSNCLFSYQTKDFMYYIIYHCRRHAPNMTNEVVVVDADYWCGEWEKKKDSAEV